LKLYVVTGANGFIGQHLVASLVTDGCRVRALTRTKPVDSLAPSKVEWVVGDIADGNTWDKLLEPGCIVINLAYSNTSATSIAVDATARMIEACAAMKVEHLIHSSTVSVYGRTYERRLTEESKCNPQDEYGQVKLSMEQTLRDFVRERFAVTIIRPSAVFGEGGIALKKLMQQIMHGRRLTNYLRSSIFGSRNTHLVPIETVVAALKFISNRPPKNGIGMFIVSDDDDKFNNFRKVEQVLMNELAVPKYCIKPIPLPHILLETMMRVMGRSIINTRTEYCSDRLAGRGFVKPVTLENALRRFARQHRPDDDAGRA
jgi:nucleoside-diphosphate-sugar epimerase